MKITPAHVLMPILCLGVGIALIYVGLYRGWGSVWAVVGGFFITVGLGAVEGEAVIGWPIGLVVSVELAWVCLLAGESITADRVNQGCDKQACFRARGLSAASLGSRNAEDRKGVMKTNQTTPRLI